MLCLCSLCAQKENCTYGFHDVLTYEIIDVDEFVWKVAVYKDRIEIYTSSDLRKLFASGRAHIPGGW